MPATVVIGSQWGDEGKGKVVDVFSSQADYVVRYQGGANAGHTLKVGSLEVVLHLIPSGILQPETCCIISSGLAVDIQALAREIQALKKLGFLKNPSQLLISDSATVLLEHHKKLDQARERLAGHEKIGTTGKGIGPAYESRAERKALIFADLFLDKAQLLERIEFSIKEKQFLLKEFYKEEPVCTSQLVEDICKVRELLQAYRCPDTSLVVSEALQKQKKVLFEGAQGSLLDLLHGTYPYVTSSSTLAGGALTGVGIGFQHLDKVLAITKAYTTRVGSGPFPTECSESQQGQYLQKQGGEFGATTGRKRRIGWLDLPMLRYAIRLNGITSLALMKLDVLSGLDEIKVCTSYKIKGRTLKDFPNLSRDLQQVEPEYKTFSGWHQDISEARKEKDLPKQARQYVDFISKELNTPIDMISVGPARKACIWSQTLF